MFTSRKEYIELLLQEQDKSCKKKEKIETNEYEELSKLKEAGCSKGKKKVKQMYETKKSLLSECLYSLFDKSLGLQLESQEKDVMKRTLVNNFIEEQGLELLLGSFKGKSYLLSEYSRIVEETMKTIIEKCEKDNCDDIDIDDELRSDFYEQLDTDDVDEIANIIKNRVANSMDEFIQNNMSDKLEIQDIIRKTQEKVDASKVDAVKESYELAGKAAISKVRNRQNKNVLESMIFSVSKATLTNDQMKKIYMTENSLDMDSIVENCEIMYTFLEMVNTAKMCKVDEKYINNILKGLKS